MRRATDAASKKATNALISIHALHEESDGMRATVLRAWLFQSTLSMRRATTTPRVTNPTTGISIHALHEESDKMPALTPVWPG